MAVIASRATDFAQPVLSPNTGPVTGLVMPDLVAPDLVAPDLVAPGAVPEVMVQLALVMEAGAGGLSGVGSEKALQVVEAVEAVKAWADSVAIDAVAAMVHRVRDGLGSPGSGAITLTLVDHAGVAALLPALSVRGRPRDPGRDRSADRRVPAPGVVGRV